MRSRRHLIIAAVLLIPLWTMSDLPSSSMTSSVTSSAQATTLKPLTLGALTRLSVFVFRGQVLSREVTRVSSGAIWTRYRISVTSPWRGALAPRDVIHLDMRGGELGLGSDRHRQEIHGQPQLEPLQEGVFFLERAASGRLVFTGMSQGWFPITRRAGVVWAERDPRLRRHLYRGASAEERVAQFTVSPPDAERIRLSALKRIVTRGAALPRSLSREPRVDVERVESLESLESSNRGER